jgi:uncharacterized phage protein (TIGR01671 family)
MREIIFRGKRVDNREWVEGDLVHDAFNGASRNIAIGIQEKGCYPVEVIPETVGQFTGLHDKEGKKIWEDDMIRVRGYAKSRVILDPTSGWLLKEANVWLAYALADADFPECSGMITNFGSIHTTPELLK